MSQRAKKSGVGLQNEVKMENSYDREEKAGTQAHIIQWMNQQLDDEAPCPGSSCIQIHRHLQDGQVLCRLINKLLERDSKPPIKYSKKAGTSFVARENITKFNDACETFGLGKECLFQSDDLFEGRKGPMLNVINNLHVLACKSNKKGFMPAYLGENLPMRDDE